MFLFNFDMLLDFFNDFYFYWIKFAYYPLHATTITPASYLTPNNYR